MEAWLKRAEIGEVHCYGVDATVASLALKPCACRLVQLRTFGFLRTLLMSRAAPPFKNMSTSSPLIWVHNAPIVLQALLKIVASWILRTDKVDELRIARRQCLFAAINSLLLLTL